MSRKGNGEGRREVGGTKNPDGGQAETMRESIRRLRAAGAEGEIAVWGRPGGTRLAALTGGLPPGLHALMLSALGAGRDLQARLRRLSLSPAEHCAALSLLRELSEDGFGEHELRRWLFSKARRRWGTGS